MRNQGGVWWPTFEINRAQLVAREVMKLTLACAVYCASVILFFFRGEGMCVSSVS